MIFFRQNTRVQKRHLNHSRYVTSFNQQYFELLNIMKQYSANYPKFPIFYANNKAICVTKPKLLISIWHEYITQKYMTQIMDENIEYFRCKILRVNMFRVNFMWHIASIRL